MVATEQAIIKVCGITRLEDARRALSAGANHLGFILYPKSRRYIEKDKALEIIAKLKTESVLPAFTSVAVCVNEALQDAKKLSAPGQFDCLQLHGDEDAAYCQQMGDRSYYKVIRLKNEDSVLSIKNYPGNRFLLETYHKDQYGGTGEKASPKLVAACLREYPEKEFLLAGGLEPEDISILKAMPLRGLDFNSGLESTAGIKSEKKLEQLQKQLKEHL